MREGRVGQHGNFHPTRTGAGGWAFNLGPDTMFEFFPRTIVEIARRTGCALSNLGKTGSPFRSLSIYELGTSAIYEIGASAFATIREDIFYRMRCSLSAGKFYLGRAARVQVSTDRCLHDRFRDSGRFRRSLQRGHVWHHTEPAHRGPHAPGHSVFYSRWRA